MSDDISRTIIDDNGVPGLGLGAGFLGGLIIGNMWNGNWGWGNNRNYPNGIGYDTGVLQGIDNDISHLNDAVTATNMSVLQNASNQNMFMGNLINSTGDAITNAIHETGSNTINAINGANISNLQNSFGLQSAIGATGARITDAVNAASVNEMQNTFGIQSSICNSTGKLAESINAANINNMQNAFGLQNSIKDVGNTVQQGFCVTTNAINSGVGTLNNTITTQGYENQLNTQRLAAQMQNQCCELSRQIEQEGCKNRELQRQIQTEAITMALADAKAQNAALTAQIGFQNSQNAQTAYLIEQLKTTAAAG